MRRSIAITTAITAGLAAAALMASPALAAFGNGPGSNDGTCPYATTTSTNGGGMMGNGGGMMGNGSGQPGSRPGMMGNGGGMMGNGGGMMGRGQNLANLPSGTLTSTQKTALAAMAEEEKLAHDVYLALGAKYPDAWQFGRIVNSETMHQTVLRALMTRYGISDATAGLPAGQFATARFQGMYDDLVSGATTTAKALEAGVAVEKADIADLTSALSGLTAPDVTQVYTNLRNASQHHLAAFGG